MDKMEKLAYQLRNVGLELKGVAHMLDNQRFLDPVPLDYPEVFEGIALHLKRLAKRVQSASKTIDEFFSSDGQ